METSSASTEESAVLTESGWGMYELIGELFPICRSITGNGVRETLRRLQNFIPLAIHEVPTGTQVFDWTVPKEWNIRDAYIKNAAGERVVDFQQSNLHVVSYSVPVRQWLSLERLRPHLFTIPECPAWIPYRTSYYKETWGFCLTHDQFQQLPDGEYEVCIDSSLSDGALTYGEYFLPGKSTDEVLLSSHICHPSLCNDNLSGVALVTFLARYLSTLPVRYSYRILFIPGTIGSITWLSLNEPRLTAVKHGLVFAGVGDSGGFCYKRSRQGHAEIDRAFAHVLRHSADGGRLIDFFPYGYDERQFCSPAFDLPVGCVMRTPFGKYSEYHTSADNLDFVQPPYLADSFAKCLKGLEILERNKSYLNQNPKCEPQLGKRGLCLTGGQSDKAVDQMAILWVLNLSDGTHSLLDIAERAGLPFWSVQGAADALLEHGLLKAKD